MSAVKWHEGSMVAYDTETTGTNPLDARIVTAAIVYTQPGARPRTLQWITDPGTPIPDEAAEVHGWTNQRLDATLRGHQALRITAGNQMTMTREAALAEIAGHLGVAMHAEAPLVVHNAAYDLTLTETELAREGIDSLTSRPGGIRGVIDPMVIEKAFDPYRKVNYPDGNGCRKGKTPCAVPGGCGATDKTLTALCAHYGVVHSGAHDASADALAAVRLAKKLAAAWPDIARLKLSTLHKNQIGWRRQQADGLRAYFDKAGIEHDGVDPGWPLYTSLTSERAVA